MPVTCPNCGGPHPRWECKMPGVFVPPKPVVTEKPKFDRVAYQKAYMKEYHKKRRAKAKENK